jgi:hypothetical protein
MQEKARPDVMGIAVQMVNASGIESTGAPHDAMYFVSFCEEQLSEVGAVLTRNSGEERTLHAGANTSTRLTNDSVFGPRSERASAAILAFSGKFDNSAATASGVVADRHR